MNINSTKTDSQQEQIFALKQFILNAPASNAQHQQALGWLHGIMQHYSDEIISMKKELETLNKQHNGRRDKESKDPGKV